MRPVTVSVTGVGSSAVIPVDSLAGFFAIGIGCIINGTVNYTVQHTFDDVYSPSFNAATATWFPSSGLTAKSANADGNYAFPVRGIRVTVNSGSGTVTMVAVQSTSPSSS